jgi:hypothetical protein
VLAAVFDSAQFVLALGPNPDHSNVDSVCDAGLGLEVLDQIFARSQLSVSRIFFAKKCAVLFNPEPRNRIAFGVKGRAS